MANCCDCELTIIAATREGAKKIYDALSEENQKRVDKKYSAMFIGSEHRYLFDPDIDCSDYRVYAYGWVKWSLVTEEMVEIVKWIESIASVISISCFIREDGCGVYGRYDYEDGALDYTWLPDEYRPYWTEEQYGEDLDAWDADLEKAFERHRESATEWVKDEDNTIEVKE